MKKATKIWLIMAASLVLVGGIAWGGAMTVLKWDLKRLSTVEYETNAYEITENFSSISMETDTADIKFVLSDDGTCTVECYEERKAKHSVTVEEDTLVVRTVNEKSWYDYIGINLRSPRITVYLPRLDFTALDIHESTGSIDLPHVFNFGDIDICLSTGDVRMLASASGAIKIKTNTGNIRVEHASAGALDLSASTGGITVSNISCSSDVNIRVSTGKTKLHDIDCINLTSSGNTGDVSLNHVIAKEKLSIRRTTGDVRLDRSDAAEIIIETDTGDVVGSLLTDKVFITHTDTGSVDTPKTVTGGKCEITTDTGDIKIAVA